MSAEIGFTGENLDIYLRELAKEYKKITGKMMPAEIILIGGAAVLANYGFRTMTYDMDAIIRASSAMKEAINRVGDRLKLPNGWLNSDFMKTTSYSTKISMYSVYYKTFSRILTVRTVSAEYLIAMKLMAGRKYKNDLSDVIGILNEHQNRMQPIYKEMIRKAVENLYGNYQVLPEESRIFLDMIYEHSDLHDLYEKYRLEEVENKNVLLDFGENYPGVVNKNNINDILQTLKSKRL